MAEMTPAEVTKILRQFNGWLRGGTQWAPTMGAESVKTAIEMIERLEAAEKSDAESIAMYRKAMDERDALRAKIETMEKQEPVWFIDERGEPKRYHKSKADYCKYGGLDLLYTLPGAQGEKK